MASYCRKRHNVDSKRGDWTVNGKLHYNMHNKHFHQLALMTLQQFLKVRCESMIVKKPFMLLLAEYNYKNKYIKVKRTGTHLPVNVVKSYN